jgi:DNA-binding transcriptional regulator YiaG
MNEDVIKKARMSLKMSQAAFANFLGVSPKAVQCWEQGYGQPNKVTRKVIKLLEDPTFLSLWSKP